MIKIKLKEHSGYGRKRYEPACVISETIMMLIPKRSTFTQEDVDLMKHMEWVVEVLAQSGWEPKT